MTCSRAEQGSSTEYMAHQRRRNPLPAAPVEADLPYRRRPALVPAGGGHPHNTSYRPAINRLRRTKDWRDLGALKAELLDLTIMERNKHAKAVVQDVKAQRKATTR